ncbi:MFS transporter [Neolewinella persica]|uniref:MFS transporter n=1 Tax=Neolewinella persica TaxID=70998 RepID=UPI0003616E86|nr:MFS transporter [Neolewinella persica]
MITFFERLGALYVKAFTGLPRRVWLLSLVMLVNRSGAMVVAFLSVYLIDKQGFEPTKAGYVMAAFGAGGVLGNYFGGLLNDRFGSWHIQFFSLIGAGILNIMLGQVTEFWALCFFAFMISLVADAFRPANRAALSIYSPPDRLTQSYGLQRMAVNLGFSIGPALGGYLIYNYGFELMFWGDGLTFLLAAAVFYFALPPDETAKPLVARPNKRQLGEEVIDAPLPAPASPPAHKQFWLVAFVIANTAIIVCFFQLFSTFGVYLKSSGFDERALGWLFTLSGVLIVATEMPVLYVVERRYRPIPTMLVGSGLIVFAYLTLPLMVSISFFAILVMVLILTMGEILYMPFTNTYVARHAPAARRGEYLGLLSSSYSFAFVITPLIGFGVAEHYGYGVATYACCGLALIGWAILSRVNILRERKMGAVVSVQ